MTRLYNTTTEKFISKIFDPYYKVNGIRPDLPENIVELEIIKHSIPEFDSETHRIERVAPVIDLEAKTYTEGWQEVALSDYEIAMKGWDYPQYPLRIIADANMATEDFGIAMYTHFSVRQLPIVPKGEVVHLYCYEISPQFQGAVDFYVNEGKVIIENKPT